jgi:hypothetical protein
MVALDSVRVNRKRQCQRRIEMSGRCQVENVRFEAPAQKPSDFIGQGATARGQAKPDEYNLKTLDETQEKKRAAAKQDPVQ